MDILVNTTRNIYLPNTLINFSPLSLVKQTDSRFEETENNTPIFVYCFEKKIMEGV